MSAAPKVTFVNARTCGIYKSGGVRYKTDPTTGQRTNEVDNELLEAVDAFLSGTENPSIRSVQLGEVEKTRVLVPTYFDQRFNAPINDLLKREGIVGKRQHEI